VLAPTVSAGGAALRSSAPSSVSSSTSNSAQASGASSQPVLTGTWKLNRAKSDDPAKKLVSNDNIPLGDGGVGGTTNVGPGANQLPPIGSSVGMGMGGMGGVGGMGGGVQSMPTAAAPHQWETDKDRQKKLEGLMPAGALTIEQKDGEFDFVDDASRKQVFYTDGRKLRKSKDDKVQEFDARWDAGHLSYDEKRPPKGKVTRTFELSADGRQMIETTEVDSGGLTVPIVIRYVYDAAPAGAAR
jgi:hypothetical protein